MLNKHWYKIMNKKLSYRLKIMHDQCTQSTKSKFAGICHRWRSVWEIGGGGRCQMQKFQDQVENICKLVSKSIYIWHLKASITRRHSLVLNRNVFNCLLNWQRLSDDRSEADMYLLYLTCSLNIAICRIGMGPSPGQGHQQVRKHTEEIGKIC